LQKVNHLSWLNWWFVGCVKFKMFITEFWFLFERSMCYIWL